MFSKLAPKNRLVLLAAFFLAGLWLIYGMAVKETLLLKNTAKSNTEQLARMEGTQGQIEALQRELEGLNSQSEVLEGGEEKFREKLLEEANSHCRALGIVLREFPKAHFTWQDGYKISTYSLLAGGSFIKLQRLVYNLETGLFNGKVSSVHYFTKTDFKTGRKSLFVKIYFQNIIKNEGDSEPL